MIDPIAEFVFTNQQFNTIDLVQNDIKISFTKQLIVKDYGIISGYKCISKITENGQTPHDIIWELQADKITSGTGSDNIPLQFSNNSPIDCKILCYKGLSEDQLLKGIDNNDIVMNNDTANLIIIMSIKSSLINSLTNQLEISIKHGSDHRDNSSHDSKYVQCIRLESENSPLMHINVEKAYKRKNNYYFIELIVRDDSNEPISTKARININNPITQSTYAKTIRSIKKHIKKGSLVPS